MTTDVMSPEAARDHRQHEYRMAQMKLEQTKAESAKLLRRFESIHDYLKSPFVVCLGIALIVGIVMLGIYCTALGVHDAPIR